MEKVQEILIISLLCASVAAAFAALLICCLRWLFMRPTEGAGKQFGTSRMLTVLTASVCLILSVWCLRYAVGYYSIITADDAEVTLTCWEEIGNSLVHALQTFSMDEDYTSYILDGKMMLRQILGEDTVWQTVYGLYASVLNLIAPVAGGAIIFEILASFFPWFKLWFAHWAVWKKKYYFSELNQSSLALAKSILGVCTNPFTRPTIVFTDVYADFDNEGNTETLLEAKSIGAICIRDDLAHVMKNRFGGRTFFLIDGNESANLQTLVHLADSANTVYLKNSEIYLFTNEDAYVQLEKVITAKLKENGFTDEQLPVFVPVQSDRNVISNLLVDVPLYEPLVGTADEEKKELVVTILGSGHMGTEMFLSVYWFGQMLDSKTLENVKLRVNVISQEPEEDFWSRIDYLNPEIRRTTQKDDPILRYNRKGEKAEPYCQVQYHQCDVKSSEFVQMLMEGNETLLSTNYFLVSLGADEDSISVANMIRKYIGQHHIHTGSSGRTVIAYVVYDSALSNMLNREQFFSYVGKTPDVYMQAIGSIRDVYSVRNVFMDEYEAAAQVINNAHAVLSDQVKRGKIHRKRMEDDYKHWASRAQAMHEVYKVYSMGLMDATIFDFPNDHKGYHKKRMEAVERYRKQVVSTEKFASKKDAEDYRNLLHAMAWLEHRRWNAFTRVKGFRGTADYVKYGEPGKKGSYKQMDIKLHPCLLECDKKGIRATMSDQGVIDQDSLLKANHDPDSEDFDLDLLDELTYDLLERKLNFYDLKLFDYPRAIEEGRS